MTKTTLGGWFRVHRRAGGLERPLAAHGQCHLVHRRAGGLETWGGIVIYNHVVHRRAGGLEKPDDDSEVPDAVHRRAGGLEKNPPSPMTPSSCSPPCRRLRNHLMPAALENCHRLKFTAVQAA